MSKPSIETQVAVNIGLVTFIGTLLALCFGLGWLLGGPTSFDSILGVVLVSVAALFAYFVFLVAEVVLNRPRVHRFLFEDVRDWKLPRL
jgi:hypothetical protein